MGNCRKSSGLHIAIHFYLGSTSTIYSFISMDNFSKLPSSLFSPHTNISIQLTSSIPPGPCPFASLTWLLAKHLMELEHSITVQGHNGKPGTQHTALSPHSHMFHHLTITTFNILNSKIFRFKGCSCNSENNLTRVLHHCYYHYSFI